ncbi:PREDICTED: chondroitin sulfate synthase 1 [Papilio polytes]|uniref:chondroitin sulfate synthase 1 n=1 Tax=Papilio polytes TaxID=76194 RepID=UPI0006761C5D|nr:PREDICTED: chondroitin sulfate synthase 1 [Papilio polytes]
MQTILHHNGSGSAAYTSTLKRREVHRAITLHPVKDHRQMYRLHTYFKNLRVQELKERSLDLHRDIAASVQELGVEVDKVENYVLPGGEPLFPHKMGEDGYLGNNRILAAREQLVYNVTEHSYLSKRLLVKIFYALAFLLYLLHEYTKAELFPKFNFYDCIISGTEIRELPIGEPPPPEEPSILEQVEGVEYEDFDEPSQQQGFLERLGVRGALESGLMRIHSNLPKVLQWNDDELEYPLYDRRINFIMPLSGRQETFGRFMKNYEDIVLKTDQVVSLIIVLYLDSKNPVDYVNAQSLVKYYTDMYSKDIRIIQMGSTTFSRGAALTEGLKLCQDDDLIFFIDVDMMFNHLSLRRIRINTIKYTQVYFPIVFSEFNPDVVNGEDYNKFKDEILIADDDIGKFVEEEEEEEPKTERELADLKYSTEINDDNGYFRQYGFGILGLFHSVDCDKNLEKSQFLMCLGTKASTYGSDKHMAYYMLNHQEVLWPQEQNNNEQTNEGDVDKKEVKEKGAS